MKLQRHRLKHLPELEVDPKLFEKRFAQGCSMTHCNATCCRGGVWLDPAEREKILDHAAIIQKHMEPQQEHNPSCWFDEDETVVDLDFPSQHALGTRVINGGCVFLNSAGHCSLQKAAMNEGMGPFALKPFYCVAFPITIDHGVLTVDDPEYTNRSECCSIIPKGTQTAFDVCEEELKHMLGEEGFNELQVLHRLYISNPAD